MTSLPSDDWELYCQKLRTEYPQAVPKGEKYVNEYFAGWAQYLILQHGLVMGTNYIQRINSLINSMAHTPLSNETSIQASESKAVKILDPVYWKTVKVYREEWKTVKKCVERYGRQLGRDIPIEEID
jgi:hypothetical protein